MARHVDLAVATRSQDVTSEREARTRDVANVCNAVESKGDCETDVKNIATQGDLGVEVESLKGDLAETKKAVGSRQAAWRIIASGEQKERTKAYEQQAADTREYTIMLEAELLRIYAGILALMDENLIPSASTGELKAFYSEKKDDYYRFLAEHATGDAKRQAPMIQKVLKTVEAPRMQYSDRIPQRTAEQAVDIPVPQVTEEIIEMFDVLSQDRVH